MTDILNCKLCDKEPIVVVSLSTDLKHITCKACEYDFRPIPPTTDLREAIELWNELMDVPRYDCCGSEYNEDYGSYCPSCN